MVGVSAFARDVPNQAAGDQLLRLHLNIPAETPLTDENIRAAVLRITKGKATLHDFLHLTGMDYGPWNLPDHGRPYFYPSFQVIPPAMDCGPEAHAYNLYFIVEPRQDGKDIFAPGGHPVTGVEIERWNLECQWAK